VTDIYEGCRRLRNVVQLSRMENEALEFLKLHLEDVRMGIKEQLPESTNTSAVALKLFDIWVHDLGRGKVVQNSEGSCTSSEPLTRQSLEKEFIGSKGSVKSAVSRARAALQSRRPAAVAGHLLYFDITEREYAFSIAVKPDPLATRRLIWSPYTGRGPITVASVKRLFFKINKDVYVRNITVDNDECWIKCDVLKGLIREGPGHAVRMYAPSGEVSAAFALIDLFNNHLKLDAVGVLISPGYSDKGKNLVVLGSGIEEPHYIAPTELAFSFKNFENGVENVKDGTKFIDEVTDATLKVYVVVQRWQKSDGNVITVVYSSHAAAVEAVVENLVSETQASKLIKDFPRIENWLKKRLSFECLFAVDLDREGRYFTPRSVSVILPDVRKAHAVAKLREVRRGLPRRV
jgi:hypothetical protein